MALGGGSFILQNKVLPGTYINFISKAAATNAFAERGKVAIGLELDWGDLFVQLDKSSDVKKIFGYEYTHAKLWAIREIFVNAKKLYIYRLNTNAVKASNNLATAIYGGIRGNDLTIKVVSAGTGLEGETFRVITLLDDREVDEQTVKKYDELKANDYVMFDKKSVSLSANAGIKLTGGTNGSVTVENHTAMLNRLESVDFNILALAYDDESTKALYTEYTKRLRDSVGKKFQTVMFNYKKANYEGVISVKNCLELVPWLAGIMASCEINATVLNRLYNGELNINADYTSNELIKAVKDGEIILHRVNDDIRVLEDINTLTEFTNDKGEYFADNQTIRVLDQIATDIAFIFNSKYLGKIPNDEAGRISLWNDVVTYHKKLENLRAIEDFKSDDIVIQKGNSNKNVVINETVKVVNAMSRLYMSVTVG